jgi:hypothetical protein
MVWTACQAASPPRAETFLSTTCAALIAGSEVAGTRAGAAAGAARAAAG